MLGFQQSKNGILTLREPKLIDPLPEDPLRVSLNLDSNICQEWSNYQSTYDCVDGNL